MGGKCLNQQGAIVNASCACLGFLMLLCFKTKACQSDWGRKLRPNFAIFDPAKILESGVGGYSLA